MFATTKINIQSKKKYSWSTLSTVKLAQTSTFIKKKPIAGLNWNNFDSKLVSGIVLLRESFSFVLVLIADNSFNGKRRKNPSHFNGIRLARCSTSFFIFCLLAHESGDLSQAETKLTLAKKAEQQNDNFFPSKWCFFLNLAVLSEFLFLLKVLFTDCYTWLNFLWNFHLQLLHRVNNCIEFIYKMQNL